MILQRYTFGSKSQPTNAVSKLLSLLMILQRYTFGSKSQQGGEQMAEALGCLWYCKDIHLEANHNKKEEKIKNLDVAYDIAKIYIWKQITTYFLDNHLKFLLLMILQRYTFGSKSQQFISISHNSRCCLWYCKDIHLEANHNLNIH